MAAAPTNAPNSGGVEPPPLSEPDLIDLNDLQALILPSTAKIFVPAPSFSEAVRAALVDYSDNSDISEKKAKIFAPNFSEAY